MRTADDDLPDVAVAPDGRLGSVLEAAPAFLAVPSDRPRPTTLLASTEHVDLALDAGRVDGLLSWASCCETDLGAILLSGFLVLLARTADEVELVVGLRDVRTPGPDDVLVVRVGVDLDAGASELVRSVVVAVEGARTRGAASLAALVAELGVEPGRAKHPVFQVAVVESDEPLDGSWPATSSVPPDLVLSWHRPADGLVLRLHYAPELFDRQRVQRMLGHLTTLLSGAVADPGTPAGRLPLLSEQETAELASWNATTYDHDDSAPLAARFWAQVEATPDVTAVEGFGTSVTYRELAARGARLARLLREAGVDSDVTVGVCAERSVDVMVAVLGVLMAGGAYVPVDPTYPPDRRDFMVLDSGAQVLLTQSALRPVVPDGFRGRVLLLDDLPEPAHSGPDDELRGRSGQDLGYVIYTSGSTGRPKAVAMPQSALDNLVAWQLRRPQFGRGTRTLQFSSISFDVSFQEVFSTWCSGGTLVLVDDAVRRDPLRLLRHIAEHKVQRLFLPNVALRGLASASVSTGVHVGDLREVYTAGEQLQIDPVMRSLFARCPDVVLENQYGPSESHVVTAHTVTGPVADWPVLPPIGAPVDNSQVHVLDTRLERRPVGVPGELYIGGSCLARGYLGRPDLTAERFVPATDRTGPGPLYKTGDLVRRRADGELEFLGRLDHQVKFRGYRIEPGEVGAVVSGCPGVAQCVAVVRELAAGPRLTAYLVPEEEGPIDLGVVHRVAKERLPGHMVPSHYLVVPSLPLTASGKVDTAALPDADFDRGILETPYRSPASGAEEVLAGIWATVLGIPEVGVDDDFFELGGDSLMAVEMAQRVVEELGREMPLGALAQSPTVAGLARLLADERTDDLRRSLVPLQPGARGVTPLFVVHGGSGNVASFPRLARGLDRSQPVYALQWNGFAGGRGCRSVEAMADHYLDEARSVQPEGPYLLAGQCIGGLVAREMARSLLRAGERVELLVMYDSPHLRSTTYVPREPVSARIRTLAGWRQLAKDLARAAYRRRPGRDPVRRGRETMRRAAWRHSPGPLPDDVVAHWVGSGVWSGRSLVLEGHWTDGALGWAAPEGGGIEVHRLTGDHDEILYTPESLHLLRAELAAAHARVAERS